MLQVVVLVAVVSFLIDALAGLDVAAVADELTTAIWPLVALAAAVAQIPRFTQTVSAMGAAPHSVPAKPLYALQLAQGYVGLAVPSSAARVAMNVRFFQKHRLSQGEAVAVGAIDSLAGFAVEAVLLGGLLLLTPQGLHFDLEAPDLTGWSGILLALVALALAVGVVSTLRPRWRHQVVAWANGLLHDGHHAVRGLRDPRRVGLLVGGNLATILTFSAALGLFAAGLGTTVSVGDLVVIVISTSLLAGLLPVPGGIGVVETSLTIGLVAAGMPEAPAVAAVVLYRLATCYLPPLWGYFAFRWLQLHGHLVAPRLASDRRQWGVGWTFRRADLVLLRVRCLDRCIKGRRRLVRLHGGSLSRGHGGSAAHRRWRDVALSVDDVGVGRGSSGRAA